MAYLELLHWYEREIIYVNKFQAKSSNYELI